MRTLWVFGGVVMLLAAAGAAWTRDVMLLVMGGVIVAMGAVAAWAWRALRRA